MSRTSAEGDTTQRWRESYGRVRKNLLADTATTNRARLALLGLSGLPRSARLLDLGAGDGNLLTSLRAAGFHDLFGLEIQQTLAMGARGGHVVCASGVHLPFAAASFDGVIVMDVMHHIAPADWKACLADIRRVLRADGVLYLCEPADTLLRRGLTLLLMSPLSELTQFSRDKRAMVEEERDELQAWLAAESGVPAMVMASGFRIELYRREWLHAYGRFRRAY